MSGEVRRGIRRNIGANDGPLIVSAGLLEPRKRFDLIIRQLAPLVKKIGATLVIAGEGSARDELSQLIKRNGLEERVVLPGFMSNLHEVLGASDVFVHAAAIEGVPQVVIQALAAGLPIVATTAAGLQEVAGAPIKLASRGGESLAELVNEALQTRPAAIDPAAFEPWSEGAVRRALTEVRTRVEQLVGPH